jgi:signal transduction histidine kinase
VTAPTKRPLVLDVSGAPGELTPAASILKGADVEVLRARDGATALVIARESAPDVVLIDVSLPDLDGYEVTQRIRADEATVGISVVHTSAGPMTAQAKRDSFEAGADAYLAQPFDAAEVKAVVRSFTRLRDAERAALRRAEALDADNQRKDEFMAMLGHEMRNPLGALRVGLSLLEACGPDEERASRARAAIGRQSDRLVRLVDDLLDVARITHGKLRLDARPVDLGHVVAGAVEVARSSFEQHGVALSLEMTSADLVVDGDATRLEQIVANLLDNALKYTPSGRRVDVAVSVVEEEPRRARLRVVDTGAGIEKKHLGAGLFTLFSQGDTSLARRDGGLGIGLTIVHRLVEVHGGTVIVSSEGLGLGATFTVELPLLPATVNATALAGDAPRGPRSGGPASRRVLLVDDHADSRELFQEVLQGEGHAVTVAGDGEEALALLVADAFEVAFIDIGLPGIDGYEVARLTRERLGDGAPLLVAMTGYGGPRGREASERAGFDAHLVKPVDAAAMVAMIADDRRPSTPER